MLKRAILALFVAVPLSAQSLMAGAHESAAVILGDTVTPKFSMSTADSAVARVWGNSVIFKSCGAAHIYLRLYHRSRNNPSLLVPITADSTLVQVIDSTATTGPCMPANAPGTPAGADGCTAAAGSMIDSTGALQVDPNELPLPACTLVRNRFLTAPGTFLDSLINNFIARTYPAPP